MITLLKPLCNAPEIPDMNITDMGTQPAPKTGGLVDTVYIYTYIQTHLYVYTYIYMYIYIYICISTHTYEHTHVYAYMYISVFSSTYIHMNMFFAWISIYM